MRLTKAAPLGSGSSAVLCMAWQQGAGGGAQSSPLAAATSDRAIHLLDSATLRPIRTLAAAHTDRINELTFAPASSLVSVSSDGTVKLWDAGASSSGGGPVATLLAGRPGSGREADAGNDEVWSASADAFLLAAGTETAVVLWDVRKAARPITRYEVHTEAVTAVRFRPHSGGGRLLSGSVDELMCEIDCTVTDEDEAVIGVHNTESPIAALGFYGADSSAAWALSSTDVVSTWSLETAERLALHDTLVGHKAADYLAHEEDGGLGGGGGAASGGGGSSSKAGARPQIQRLLPPLDYLAGCHWNAAAGRLLLLGGTKSGEAHVLELPSELPSSASAGQGARGEAPTGGGGGSGISGGSSGISGGSSGISGGDGGDGGDGGGGGGGGGGALVRHLHALGGGHADVMRCFYVLGGSGNSGIVTGGDDGRLCAWGEASSEAAGAAAGEEAATASGGGGPRSKMKEKKDKAGRAKPYDRPGKAV